MPRNKISRRNFLCEACREAVLHKKSTIQTRLKTNKHMKGKKCLEQKKVKMNLVKLLKLHDQEHYPIGEILSGSVR